MAIYIYIYIKKKKKLVQKSSNSNRLIRGIIHQLVQTNPYHSPNPSRQT